MKRFSEGDIENSRKKKLECYFDQNKASESVTTSLQYECNSMIQLPCSPQANSTIIIGMV